VGGGGGEPGARGAHGGPVIAERRGGPALQRVDALAGHARPAPPPGAETERAQAGDGAGARTSAPGQRAARISSRTGSRYFRNWAGCSLIGKWPISRMMVTRAPGMRAAVRSVSSGVHEKSYSPVSR
jgi:hypothetical protein